MGGSEGKLRGGADKDWVVVVVVKGRIRVGVGHTSLTLP